MDANAKLIILKSDLKIMHSADDAYLQSLLELAEAAMKRIGIVLVENDIEIDMVACEYAAYLYRSRASDNANTAMPKFLDAHLKNILFSQKAGGINAI